jgi:hypothetical protein
MINFTFHGLAVVRFRIARPNAGWRPKASVDGALHPLKIEPLRPAK